MVERFIKQNPLIISAGLAEREALEPVLSQNIT